MTLVRSLQELNARTDAGDAVGDRGWWSGWCSQQTPLPDAADSLAIYRDGMTTVPLEPL